MSTATCEEAWNRSRKRSERIVVWTCVSMVTVNLLLVVLL